MPDLKEMLYNLVMDYAVDNVDPLKRSLYEYAVQAAAKSPTKYDDRLPELLKKLFGI